MQALADVEAIDAWMREVYPAFVDPLYPDFGKRWESAVAMARERAAQVETPQAWRATLAALVGAARDGHVLLSFSEPPETLGWSGFTVELRADRYHLVQLGSDTAATDAGELVSCNGEPIASFAEQTLDLFRGNWANASERPQMVAELLVNTGNPFVPQIENCVVVRDGQRIDWRPRWEPVCGKEVGARLLPHRGIWYENANNIGLDIRPDGAIWISVGNLIDEQANAQLNAQLEAGQERIQTAAYIVWDLRGNPGGNSELGDRLIEAVWGEDTIPEPPRGPRPHAKLWRVSAPMLEAFDRNLAAAEEAGRGEIARFVRARRDAFETALGQDLELVPDPESSAADEGSAPVEKAKTGPVFVLTDPGCFSSCITMTNTLGRMGVVQVGFPTAKDTVYGEAWFSRPLPSGRATLTLPVAIFNDPPDQLGGLLPALPWTGPAMDHAGIEAFIAREAASSSAADGTRRGWPNSTCCG